MLVRERIVLLHDFLCVQKMNFLFVIVETGTSKCSKATISSAETMLLRILRHSIWLSLKELASCSMSSIIIKLLLMSKSLRVLLRFLMTSESLLADFPLILVSERWQTRMLLESNMPCAIYRPASSPICSLSFNRISRKLLLMVRSCLIGSADSSLIRLWLKNRRSNRGSALRASKTWLAPRLRIRLYSSPSVCN